MSPDWLNNVSRKAVNNVLKPAIYARFAGSTLLSVNDKMNHSSPQAIQITNFNFFSIVKYLSEKKISLRAINQDLKNFIKRWR